MAIRSGSSDGSSDGDGSGEVRDLFREIRDEDPAVAERTLHMLRGIVGAMRTRRAPSRANVSALFGAGNRKTFA